MPAALPGHPLLACAEIRRLEARGLAATPDGTLMSRAADAVARTCADLLRTLPARTPVLALAGPGNNGGDALLAALVLAERGWSVHGLALSPAAPSATDARRVRDAWHASGRPLATPAELDALLDARPLVIDGLFGIGLARPLPPDAAAIAGTLAARGATVVAVDVPSGLGADRGAVVGGESGTAIRATSTVTMIADKPGLRTGAGVVHAGHVVVADLGLPALGIVPESRDADAESAAPARARADWLAGSPLPHGRLIDAAWVGARLPGREPDAHKGRFGDVLVLEGAPAMRGAAVLAVLGAQAVGAGRLYLGVPVPGPADPLRPELMSRHVCPDCASPSQGLGDANAIVCGCGLGTGPAAARALAAAIAHPAALVLDADGLNGVAADRSRFELLRARAAAGRPSVLTPHPLEAARLLGTGVQAVQADRIGAACRLAAATGACVVLKGAGSVVALPDGSWSIVRAGGPILSVAGTGDVLAGAIGGLLATGLAPADAAACGAWLHGAAGDALAAQDDWRASIGLPASRLPDAIRAEINRRAGRC